MQVGDRIDDHDAAGWNVVDQPVHRRQVHLQPVERRARGVEPQQALLAPSGSRSMPIERMLRMIWLGDSSNAKYRQRSPRRQAASTKCAARLVLPVPAVPETSTLLPRK